MGLTNASIAWNMKAVTQEGIDRKMKRVPIFQFQTVLAHQLLNYKTRVSSASSIMTDIAYTCDKHVCIELTKLDSPKQPECTVCRLEEKHFIRKRKLKVPDGAGLRIRQYLWKCVTCCNSIGKNVFVHKVMRPVENCRKIFSLDCFKNMNCEAIFHSTQANCMWKKGVVQTSHTIYKQLVNLWDQEPVHEKSDLIAIVRTNK